MGDAQDARGIRRLDGARLRRAAAAALTAGQVHQGDTSAAGRLLGEGAAHDELGIVGMRADAGDVEGGVRHRASTFS
jgi:hypothetical protein